MSGGEVDGEAFVRSVDRAVAVMEILARDGWCGVTEIAMELGIHKSTAFRLLTTLESRGMVEQHADTQKYRLGFGLVRLAASVRSSLDLLQAAIPVCDRLSLRTHETVNVAVLQGREVVNIHQVNQSPSRVVADWLGAHTDLHSTSSGKVFLAYAPPDLLDELLGGELERHTPHTLTDPAAIREQLPSIRQEGYATTFGELEEGLHAVGAPVLGPDGAVVASVTVSGPSYRLGTERMGEVGRATAEAAAEISHRLGFLGARPSAPRSQAMPVRALTRATTAGNTSWRSPRTA